MAREREVGTLWIGGELSWMEQLCLKSFVDQGQKITLFSYEEIPNVPEGVIQRDGREIIDTDDFIKYEKKNSFALFADWFRLHMIHQCPGMIWVDTDVYCHRPMDYDSDYVFGFELPGEYRVNNAVLGLPADSELLKILLEFTNNRYSIAPFLSSTIQKEYQLAAANGKPVHVTQQPWGVWGPRMVTYFVHALELAHLVQPLDAFYPITFPERRMFLKAKRKVDVELTENTTALHLWASNKRKLGANYGGLAPEGSYFDDLLKKHKINPAKAPIKERGNNAYIASLIDQVPLDQVEHVACLTGASILFLISVYNKFDCQLHLIPTNRMGEIDPEQTDWLDETIQALMDNGVDLDAINVIENEEQLRPVDILCNLEGFGCVYRIATLEKFLTRCFHADTIMFADIRRGSAGFPFLRRFGVNEILSEFKLANRKVSRVLFRQEVKSVDDDDGTWAKIASDLAGDKGWYREGTNGHSMLYVARDPDTLVVTFDNLDITMTKRDDRRPWGYSFIEKQGWSMLGVLAGGWTWYREDWIYDQFNELKNNGFFKGFKRVVFYGASMGGYAACAFSPAAPGCDVVAISPQSTVDKSIVPWETRYKVVWNRNFDGSFGDAAKVSSAANKVTILFDPYEPLDMQHAARFENENVVKLRAPLLGHRLGSSLNQMGILSPIILGALTGDLSQKRYQSLLTARKTFPRYQRELFQRALEKGHETLAINLAEYVLKRNPNPGISKALRALRQQKET